jgi:hypothetical protein
LNSIAAASAASAGGGGDSITGNATEDFGASCAQLSIEWDEGHHELAAAIDPSSGSPQRFLLVGAKPLVPPLILSSTPPYGIGCAVLAAPFQFVAVENGSVAVPPDDALVG